MSDCPQFQAGFLMRHLMLAANASLLPTLALAQSQADLMAAARELQSLKMRGKTAACMCFSSGGRSSQVVRSSRTQGAS